MCITNELNEKQIKDMPKMQLHLECLEQMDFNEEQTMMC
jgi:hypothetical protein